jgi:hypothetical protein
LVDNERVDIHPASSCGMARQMRLVRSIMSDRSHRALSRCDDLQLECARFECLEARLPTALREKTPARSPRSARPLGRTPPSEKKHRELSGGSWRRS